MAKKLIEVAGCALLGEGHTGATIRPAARHHVRAGFIAILLSRNGHGSVT